MRRAVADTLTNLASFLAEIGDREAGRAAAAEAVNIARDLTALSREHVPALAGALTNMASRLHGVGRFAEAVDDAEEALELYRGLASRNPAFESDVALMLSNLGSMLDDVARPEEALRLSSEALTLRRRLQAAGRSSPGELANSLINVANLLSDRGRSSEALALASEAVAIRRDESRDNSHLIAGLANALDSMAVFAIESGQEDLALASINEAVSILRRLASANAAFVPDLAGALNNAAAIADRSVPDDAIGHIEESVEIHRRLVRSNPAFVAHLATSLDSLATVLAESGRANDAVVAATESVEIRRELVQDSGMSVAALTGALHNLSNRYEELGRANEALQLASEIVGLEGRVDATAAAIHRLLEVAPTDRPDVADALLVAALDRLREIVHLALWSVADPGDRRALLENLAWVASAGAVYLAIERHDCDHALAWLDSTMTIDLRANASLRSTEFAELEHRRPDLAGRLRKALGAVTRDEMSPDADVVEDVIRDVREAGSGFERFLRTRTSDEITAALDATTVIVAAGPRSGVLLFSAPGEPPTAEPLDLCFDDLTGPALQSMSARPVQAWIGHARLRELVEERVVPVIANLATSDKRQATSDKPIVVVPVGLTNWLPSQAVLTLAGWTVELRPAITLVAEPRTWTGPALVVHSNGRGPTLDAARDECTQVATMAGVAPLFDPIDVGEVCRRIGSSRFVHFSCHAVATVGDPDSSGLQLGPSDDYHRSGNVHVPSHVSAVSVAMALIAVVSCLTGSGS